MHRARRIDGTQAAEYAATLVQPEAGPHPRHEELRAEMRRFVATAERPAVVGVNVTREIRASNGELLCRIVELDLECGHRASSVTTPSRGAEATRACVACYAARQETAWFHQADLFEAAQVPSNQSTT